MNDSRKPVHGAKTSNEVESKSSAEPSDEIRDAFTRVPHIGGGWRWYDIPYRILDLAFKDQIKRILPERVLDAAIVGMNYLIPFNEHERNVFQSATGTATSLNVGTDEHVNIPCIWVVDLFPPSSIPQLERTLKRKWKKKRTQVGAAQSNSELLTWFRAGPSRGWWSIASIANSESDLLGIDRVKMRLPEEFDSIDLYGLHVGSGLTAVSAKFRLSSSASQAVDESWHITHKPELVRVPGERRRAEDSWWSSLRRTQEARSSLHEAARNWLAKELTGVLGKSKNQLAVDLVILSTGVSDSRTIDHESLRAIGIATRSSSVNMFSQPAGMYLDRFDDADLLGQNGRPTWCMWGYDTELYEILGPYDQGSPKPVALAHHIHYATSGLLVLLGISEMLKEQLKTYSELRDSAQARHGEFRLAQIKQLRRSVLTLSLDVASVLRDLDQLHSNRSSLFEEPDIIEVDSPWVSTPPAHDDDPASFNDRLRELQREQVQRLSDLDRDYREILSTVASLGAAVDSSSRARTSSVIALASAMIAILALLSTKIDPASPLLSLFRWITDIGWPIATRWAATTWQSVTHLLPSQPL